MDTATGGTVGYHFSDGSVHRLPIEQVASDLDYQHRELARQEIRSQRRELKDRKGAKAEICNGESEIAQIDALYTAIRAYLKAPDDLVEKYDLRTLSWKLRSRRKKLLKRMEYLAGLLPQDPDSPVPPD